MRIAFLNSRTTRMERFGRCVDRAAEPITLSRGDSGVGRALAIFLGQVHLLDVVRFVRLALGRPVKRL